MEVLNVLINGIKAYIDAFISFIKGLLAAIGMDSSDLFNF